MQLTHEEICCTQRRAGEEAVRQCEVVHVQLPVSCLGRCEHNCYVCCCPICLTSTNQVDPADQSQHPSHQDI